MPLGLIAAVLLMGCVASDGDSLRCGRERIRLLGIDAPELSRCQPRRTCAPGDPVRSRDHLRSLLNGRRLLVERVGRDRYGRTLAVVHAGAVNLSCAQIKGRYALYRREWDNGRRIAKTCPAVG